MNALQMRPSSSCRLSVRANSHSLRCSMQAVDDCTTVAAIFKLLEGFEGLLEREAIAGELERKYLELLAAFSVDIRQVS